MSVILILILASLGLALAFLASFIWAVRAGQYEDTCTPSMRVLLEGEHSTTNNSANPILINTSLQRGETASQDNSNRFSGFLDISDVRPGAEAAEAVTEIKTPAISRLKPGVNENENAACSLKSLNNKRLFRNEVPDLNQT